MKVCEIFESIQGEGKFCGQPALFIRLSGCTRECSFCDSKYHIKGKEMSVKEVVSKIKKCGVNYVVWTGGEPMMQEDNIYDVILKTNEIYHHLETNGDKLPQCPKFFSYIAFSPKEKRVQENVLAFCLATDVDWDIKVVTDLKLNENMIEDATILMPLTTEMPKRDIEIQQDVWNYCVKNNIKYTPRIHRDVWGVKKGI